MFYFDKNFGLFIGKLTTNEFHKHYALQISISEIAHLKLTLKEHKEQLGNAFYIASNVEHKLTSQDNQLTILINPLSPLGHYLFLNFGQVERATIPQDLENKLLNCLNSFYRKEIEFQTFCSSISDILHHLKCSCEKSNHSKDERIIEVLEFLDKNVENSYSLEELADLCFLSPSRFLHLFKEKTGLSFRRFQLWNKIIKSLPHLTENSITDTAYKFGFTDSSHYTRTFKETFGVNPKFMFLKE
jgi:AraC-like DNA-binding protein